MSTQWLRALECPLLQHADDGVPITSMRLVQRLLEIAMMRQSVGDVAQALLQEIAGQLRADYAGVWEATPTWQVRWNFTRPGTRSNAETVARPLLGDILDRQA